MFRQTANDEPMQTMIAATAITADLVFSQHDMRTEPTDAVAAMLQDAASLAFHLQQGPLFWGKLIQTDDNVAILVINMHHIISDGWSLGIIIRELAELYSASIANRDANLPALPLQYADYAYWQRHWLRDDILANQLRYWQRQLADAPPLLPLPTDHPRPQLQTFNGRTVSFAIANELTTALKQLSQTHNVTLFISPTLA